MNYLEKLKQKMIVKPKIEERKPVYVKLNNNQIPQKNEKSDRPIRKEIERNDLSDKLNRNEQRPDNLERHDKPKKTLIIDETQKGFNRELFLKKFKDANIIKTVASPVIQKEVEIIAEKLNPSIQEPIQTEQKPKSIKINRPFRIVEESQIEEPPIELQVEEPVKINIIKSTKECPEGKEINPKTKRCVNECKSGFIRNEEFKCVKGQKQQPKIIIKEVDLEEEQQQLPQPPVIVQQIQEPPKAEPKKSTKECPEGKELNPKTKRCVNECKSGFIRNEEFKCVKGQKITQTLAQEQVHISAQAPTQPQVLMQEPVLEEETEKINPRKRFTTKIEKGIAILGPENIIRIGDTSLKDRLPDKKPPIIIQVPKYVMNDRETFVNFINSIFEPYKREIEDNSDSISCDNIGKTSSNFSLLTHQKIVRDYLNLYTPYRGLLLYHGLGSGKSCTSIAIAEGMKDSKCVIILLPASLKANYIEELKKCGDLLYKRNQYWEWISIKTKPQALPVLSSVLNLSIEYIKKNEGAFLINIKKPSNYNDLNDADKTKLEEQLNEMISHKYKFINYNGLREKKLRELTMNYTKNIFDNSVVIIDEAHNFISRIVNKLKKEKQIKENKRGEKEHLPLNMALKLYELLLIAINCRIVLLSGTPIINYPNEFAILFNILRGYIKTWKFPLVVNTTRKIDKEILYEILLGDRSSTKTLDYLDYSPSSKMLIVTKNPFGFKNILNNSNKYQGVSTDYKENNLDSNSKQKECNYDEKDIIINSEYIETDDDFERKIVGILRKNDIEVLTDQIEIKYRKALPDNFDEFMNMYTDTGSSSLKNTDSLKRRIIGLSSYFKSAQENLLPRYNKQLGVDYHIIRAEMSDFQFTAYESARKEERLIEKRDNKKSSTENSDLFSQNTSTYRIFSRLFCNYVIPDRPRPISKTTTEIAKEADKIEKTQDLENENEGEIEGDEILDEIGGKDYKERLNEALIYLEQNSDDYLTPEALQIYSPKFLYILENIQDPDHVGLHLLYSQFRTAEGITILSLVLNKNGFARFKINKNSNGVWEIDMNSEIELGKPTYALYTGTETSEEKEIIRHIYNGEWDQIPDSISSELLKKYRNNNLGEVIKILMITSSGSEGINLKNTRYVHITEPYWHPVRIEQIIGRARRICSHKDLPIELQTVEVFIYLMKFSEKQIKSDEAIELKRQDLSKSIPRVAFTSDQYLYEISEIKANLTAQLTDIIKQTAFDCYLYSNGKCVNFGDTNINKFSYTPDYKDQQNDLLVQANKMEIQWKGKILKLGQVTYIAREINKNLLYIYDKKSYEDALKDPSKVPLQIGTLEKNQKGENVFKQVVI